METYPKVVIVGRPNVGKSSLFNRILGRRAAVVANRDGVTRDRHFQAAEWNDCRFQLVDTGGFINKHLDEIDKEVSAQITLALEEADLAIFLADARTGPTDLDMEFSRLVKRVGRPCLLAINKAESQAALYEVPDFWKLGMGEPRGISALQGIGVADLLDEVVHLLQLTPRPPIEDKRVRVAILGRPNAGKSTLVNTLLGESRLVTSSRPGTTRDAIDTEILFEGQSVVLTDTAGLRKKARVKDEVEYFSNMRALESIRRSHICVLLIDAPRGLEVQDLRILEQIEESGRGVILGLNKWDLVDAGDKTFDHLTKQLRADYPDLNWVPMVSLSGLSGKRVQRLMQIVLQVYSRLGTVFGRDKVVEFFQETVLKHPHPSSTKGPVHLKRLCQVTVYPPALALECTRPDLVEESYVRYLKKQAYSRFDLEGVPLRIYFRKRLELRSDEELQQTAERLLHKGVLSEEEPG